MADSDAISGPMKVQRVEVALRCGCGDHPSKVAEMVLAELQKMRAERPKDHALPPPTPEEIGRGVSRILETPKPDGT